MKIFISIYLALAVLLALTFSVDVFKTHVVEYEIVNTTGTTTEVHHSKMSRYEVVPGWLWSVKNVKTGAYVDKDVSFSDFSRFHIGDHVVFTEIKQRTTFENFIFFLRVGFIVVFLAMTLMSPFVFNES